MTDAQISSILSSTIIIGTCLLLSYQAYTAQQRLPRLLLPCMTIIKYFAHVVVVVTDISFGPVLIVECIQAIAVAPKSAPTPAVASVVMAMALVAMA